MSMINGCCARSFFHLGKGQTVNNIFVTTIRYGASYIFFEDESLFEELKKMGYSPRQLGPSVFLISLIDLSCQNWEHGYRLIRPPFKSEIVRTVHKDTAVYRLFGNRVRKFVFETTVVTTNSVFFRIMKEKKRLDKDPSLEDKVLGSELQKRYELVTLLSSSNIRTLGLVRDSEDVELPYNLHVRPLTRNHAVEVIRYNKSLLSRSIMYVLKNRETGKYSRKVYYTLKDKLANCREASEKEVTNLFEERSTND